MRSDPVSDITQILSEVESGDPKAAEQLLRLVHDELLELAAPKLAQEKPGQALPATALVQEAYLRLVDVGRVRQWRSRGHFFAAAAEAMRLILVDHAQRAGGRKRSGQQQRIPLDTVRIAFDTPPDELLALNAAIEGLHHEYPDCAELATLRFFAGLSQGEAAAALGIPRRTADRDWVFARAWLFEQLNTPGDSAGQ